MLFDARAGRVEQIQLGVLLHALTITISTCRIVGLTVDMSAVSAQTCSGCNARHDRQKCSLPYRVPPPCCRCDREDAEQAEVGGTARAEPHQP